MSKYLYCDKQLLYKYNDSNDIPSLLAFAAAVVELDSAQSVFLVSTLYHDHFLDTLIFKGVVVVWFTNVMHNHCTAWSLPPKMKIHVQYLEKCCFAYSLQS